MTATSGDTVSFRIDYRNAGTTSINNVVINDAQLADITPLGNRSFSLGTLQPGASGFVTIS